MTAEHDIGQLFPLDHAQHIGDVRFERDGGAQEVGALAEARQGRCIDVVAGASQQPRHALVAPAAQPSPVHQ
jgi:hypothetical protein